MNTFTIETMLEMIQQAQGDPQALLITTARIACMADDEDLFPVLEAAAIPHWFDTAILARLLDTDETSAGGWLEKLLRLPMVESFALRKGWNVHEATRLALRSYLAAVDPARLNMLSTRAVDCFPGDDPAWRIESIFHRLLAAPEDGAAALETLWKDWDNAGRSESLQALGFALDELLQKMPLADTARTRTLLCLGWCRRNILTTSDAEKMAREALKLFQALGDEQGIADAHDQLGDILQAQGQRANALKEFGAAKEINLQLTQRDPGNSDWQRELSVSHNKIGRIYEVHGKLTEALREYEASQTIRFQLTNRDPDNAGWQRDLSVTHHNIGRIYLAQGKLAEALREYEAAHTIKLHLTQRDPDNAGWQRDLSLSRNNIGRIYEAQGKLAEALREYIEDQKIMFQLTQRDTDNAGWQRDLSVSHNNIGRIDQAQGKLAEALREYEVYQKIMFQLT